MKKLFFLSGLMLFASMAFVYSQPQEEPIEDGGFENKWVQKSSPRGSYFDFNPGDDVLLRTLNSLYEIEIIPEFTTQLTCFRESNNPHSGQYSLRMETVSFGNLLLVPGIYASIPKDYVDQFIDTEGFEILSFFESKPKKLTGYYKYAPVNNDSAAIEIELLNYDVRTAYALWKEKNTVSEWTRFEIPINYVNEWFDVTDLKLIFASSAGYNFANLMDCKGQIGSKFWIDDIAFEYGGSGLCEPLMDRTCSTAFPNPANTTISISFDKVLNGKLVIYNMLGAEVSTLTVNGNSVEANISHLTTGSYFYRVIEGNIIRTSGKFIVK
jgi:hypothetical protein